MKRVKGLVSGFFVWRVEGLGAYDRIMRRRNLAGEKESSLAGEKGMTDS